MTISQKQGQTIEWLLGQLEQNGDRPAPPLRRPPVPPRRCGAYARSTGRPCARKPLANGRCRNHGGLSTGPRTAEGLQRIAHAQKTRWARWRVQNPRLFITLSKRHERRLRKLLPTVAEMTSMPATNDRAERRQVDRMPKWQVNRLQSQAQMEIDKQLAAYLDQANPEPRQRFYTRRRR
jgi:hypothetical protein